MKDQEWYEVRFWQRVQKGRDCWNWQGGGRGDSVSRYGLAWNGTRILVVHRWSYEMCIGPIPHNSEVNQVCGNRLCVRPDHLEVTSRTATMRQKIAKRPGTPTRGERNHRAKLTESEVVTIRNLYAQRDVTFRALALEFDVSQTVIGKVVRGETWTHASGPRRKSGRSPQSNTGYWGVSYSRSRSGKKYQAWLIAHGQRFALGFYETALAAARARDAKALEVLGDSAILNFPGDRGE